MLSSFIVETGLLWGGEGDFLGENFLALIYGKLFSIVSSKFLAWISGC